MGKISDLVLKLLIIQSLTYLVISNAPGAPSTSSANTTTPTVSTSGNSSSPSTATTSSASSNASHVNNTIRAWSAPNSTTKPRGLFMYSSEMLEKLVKNYHGHTTTNDLLNEQYYTYRRLGDNVWFNIERVAPYKTFMNWMISTNRITDRSEHGKSLISSYIRKAGESCAPETVFEVPDDIILSDNKNVRVNLDSVITQWFQTNENTPPEKMCNRFIGLTCSGGSCTCGKDASVEYLAYDRTSADAPGEYQDGCYVKAWKSCHHLSYDANIPAEYKAFHAHRNNMKQLLMRMATPLPSTPRCEKGTYCVDMILNKHRPICWCASKMKNKDCYRVNGSIPLLTQFLEIRKKFHTMLILERDREAKCTIDPELDEFLQAIHRFSDDPQENFFSILKLMKQAIRKGTRFCDFRKGMACDPYKLKCSYKLGCGSGRIQDTKGVCLVDNGYPCPAVELQCIPGAECKNFGAGRHCHCVTGKYGEQCRYDHPTFFGALLQSRTSGFVGFHFVNLQELVNNVLAPLERLMTGGLLQPCNPNSDGFAMKIVRYLGNVRTVNLDEMDSVLGAVQVLVGKDELLCDYRKFLRCTVSGICEPMISDVAIYEVQDAPEIPGNIRINLRLKPRARCSGPGNFSNIPAIFQDVIHVQCLPYQVCKSAQGRMALDKFCLCPDGFQGIDCSEKIPQAVKYAHVPISKTVVFGRLQKTKRVGRCISSDGTPCFSHV